MNINIKAYIFFFIIFSIIIFAYFNYDIFLKYCPINNLIKLSIVIIGVLSFFAPGVIKKLKEGDDINDIKKYIIEKYKKKN